MLNHNNGVVSDKVVSGGGSERALGGRGCRTGFGGVFLWHHVTISMNGVVDLSPVVFGPCGWSSRD